MSFFSEEECRNGGDRRNGHYVTLARFSFQFRSCLAISRGRIVVVPFYLAFWVGTENAKVHQENEGCRVREWMRKSTFNSDKLR